MITLAPYSNNLRRIQALLVVLLSLVLLDANSRESYTPPTFGEQMRELVEARERGELTFEELMALRDALSKKYASGIPENSEIDKPLRNLVPQDKKPVTTMPISAAQTKKSSHHTTPSPEKVFLSDMTADPVPAPEKPALNCNGLRKFLLRCLRR
jgi:hypothetical protein